jgi:ABC-type lipoprotein export system ATPase subunit
MIISLEKIIPIPLKDKLQKRVSAIWNNAVQFNEKQFVKIKAPSGTGKTTLIHYLYGLRNDYEGSIFYNKETVKNIQDEKMAMFRQQNISIIFQDLRLFDNLTALQNIELKLTMHQPFITQERLTEMVSILGIQHIMHQPAKICSYGEQQRIAIVRALVQPFDWLLLDEPFSHLDKENTQKAASLIAEECQKRQAGFILTDLDEDENFAYQKFYNL